MVADGIRVITTDPSYHSALAVSGVECGGGGGRTEIEALLDGGHVGQVVSWLHDLIRLQASINSEHEQRQQLPAQKKRLSTLKQALLHVEAALKRQEQVLELQLAPGLSTQFSKLQLDEPHQLRRFPLSYAQQQMYALYQMQPESTAYNITRAVRISMSAFELSKLEAACRALLSKHEALRSLFVVDDVTGEPRQVVLSIGQCRQPIVQVLEWTREQGEYRDDKAMAAFLAATTSVPFDLVQDIPVRFIAVASPDGSSMMEWTLVVVLHHIVTDGASSVIVWNDLLAMYASPHLELSPVDDTVVNYRDYAVWQRERVESGVIEPTIAYWCRQLAGEDSPTPVLSLPFDYTTTRSPRHEGQGDAITFTASSDALTRMTTSCGAQGCSLYMGLLSVFYMLLSRLSGSSDIVIGTPTSGRDRVELEHIVGYFVNTLALRIHPTEIDTFQELLATVRDVVLNGFANMEAPFHEVVRRIRAAQRRHHRGGDAEASMLDHGLYQVMFSLESGANDGDSLHEVPLPHTTAKFDLMLTMRVNRDDHGRRELQGELEFPLDKFSRATAERFARYYCKLLDLVTLEPRAKLTTISMLPLDEHRKLIHQWGAPAASVPLSSCFLDECLRVQVAKSPESSAVHFEGSSWSYQQLWDASGRVAHALHSLKRTGDGYLRVGLLTSRGFESAAAIIGALRARAVFVPLDAAFPAARLAYMVQDSAVHTIVSQQRHASIVQALLPSTSDVQVLLYEDLSAEPGDVPATLHADDMPAYILYTSGSTGKPKGVVVTHGNLLSTIQWTVRTYAVGPDSVFLQSTSTTLDGSLTQLLSPLMSGGTVVITKDGGLQDLAYISGLLSTVSFCVFVPSYLSLLIEFLAVFPPAVRHVVVVGEAFSMELARKFYRKFESSSACLVNEYGPTEAAVTSTSFFLSRNRVLDLELDTVPIGTPIDDHYTVVLDTHKQLVPVNVPGELYVGGRGVATGYWRRPELSAAAFSHPEVEHLTGEAISKWYRTGDIVKWLPTGHLVFLGRADAQVKLNGLRVELNEVRNELMRHEGVRDAEVQVLSTKRKSKGSLVAFVMSDADPDELRSYLRDHLPSHMVPHEIRSVDAWPRTPNGKLDVRVLLETATKAAPRLSTVQDEQPPVRLATRLAREALVEIWTQVLELEDEQVDWKTQSFVALGGDSLAAIRAISLARTRGISLAVDTFFRCHSVDEMAILASSTADARTLALQPLVPLNIRSCGLPTLFLVHGADGTVWKLRELAQRLPFPVVGLQATSTTPESVEHLADKYWAAIQRWTATLPASPIALGGFSFGCRVAHAIARLAVRAGRALYPLTLLDGVPFYLGDGSGGVDDADEASDFADTFCISGANMGEDETALVAQVAAQFRAHCAIGGAYRPQQQHEDDVRIAATLFKTDRWDVDVDEFKVAGADIATVEFPGSSHLSLLRSVHVDSLGVAIREQFEHWAEQPPC